MTQQQHEQLSPDNLQFAPGNFVGFFPDYILANFKKRDSMLNIVRNEKVNSFYSLKIDIVEQCHGKTVTNLKHE